MEKARSLLVDLDAEPSIVPLTRARRPSFGSPTAPALRAIAEGGVPVPTTAMPPLGGRSSTWPYGSARTPRTSSSVPRAGAATPSGSLTGIPPVASAMARSGGVPSLPASATTTPRTNTVVPIGLSRAAAMVIGGDALGEADGAAEGEAEGAGDEAGSGRWRRLDGRRGFDGRRRGRRRASGVAVGDGVGGGGDLELAGERGVEAVPLEAGPRAVALAERAAATTIDPRTGSKPSSAAGPAITRTAPEPSSIIRPRPSLSALGASVTVPTSWSRRPSSGSAAAPVCTSSGVGSHCSPSTATSARSTRSVRWPNRLSTEPVARIRVPAGTGMSNGASR